LVYKVLDQLEETGLVLKHDIPKKVAIFEAVHPVKLNEIAEEKEKQAKTSQSLLSSLLPDLSSLYNLSSGKPSVRVFEGVDGMWQLLQDNLKSRGEVLSYADFSAVVSQASEVNDRYTKTRKRIGIKKRTLILNTEHNKAVISKIQNTDLDAKLLKNPTITEDIPVVSYIYDNKCSFLTFSDEKIIGVIIENQFIANHLKLIFESNWQSGEALKPSSQNPL
jgi:sugar-specific transcriptional regulator TrmB